MPSVNWTLHVEELGPIRQADINVRPLTLLVGENSTGKSYLATLLWGLAQTNRVSTFPITPDNEPRLKDLETILGNSNSFSLSKSNLDLFSNFSNHFLEKWKHYIIPILFNTALVSANKINLKFNHRSDSTISIKPAIEIHPRSYSLMTQFQLILNHALGLNGNLNAKYIPASRTGFMLSYPYIVNKSLDETLSDSSDILKTKLTKPTVEFLKLIATGGTEGSPFMEEAQALEEALGGNIIQQSQAGFHHYQYRMKGAELGLPMSVVSTMVSELAPIITILKGSRTLPFLVIEEPEAHLHPKIQRILAVVIARLIRKGVCITLTTHSDIFCHQLNNLIKLGSLPEAKRRVLQKKFKLKPTDYLLPEEVSGYGLTLSKDRTQSLVEALRMTQYGLVMPTFNQEIDQLEAQSDILDKAIEAAQ